MTPKTTRRRSNSLPTHLNSWYDTSTDKLPVALVYLLVYYSWGGKQAPNVHFSFLIQLCVKVMGLKLLIHVSMSVSKLACRIQTEIIRHWSNLEESNWSATLYDDGRFAFTCKLSGHCKEGPGIHLKTITKCYPSFYKIAEVDTVNHQAITIGCFF